MLPFKLTNLSYSALGLALYSSLVNPLAHACPRSLLLTFITSLLLESPCRL
ncbi:hypothetical protein HanXRQr2_Chr15g0686951 [Helianthus annuus]|uniref:Uncharacterized protein n=1 Tax=Helianthus annuus TaxID=4232 RepID=A0A9K3E0Z5_HELAN|nr:hypothetical protein HanXRQr2_Chr15g0686951 [Helianthus annuus]KAJ0830747.1 hypothetical protein HanPSC8_Chr15g0658971 [Helianthus annuus]